jgi:Phosphotransferase enzyme family
MTTSPWFPEAAEIVERSQLTGAAEALSGARFERVVLGDGRRMVLKYLPPEGDWLTRLTAGAGRLRLLWDSGTLAQVAVTVDHTIVALVPSNGADVVVMRDVSDTLLATGSRVSPPQIRKLVAGLAVLHRAWQGHALDGLCPPEARYRLFAPHLHASDDGPNRHPAREIILAGWQVFAEIVPTDVADAVFAVHKCPELLAGALMASAPATLVHGDAKLENLGVSGSRLVAIDWGELTGVGPAEIDVAWLAMMSGWRMDALPDEVFAAYDQRAYRRLDPMALDLACIGSLAQMGFKLASRARATEQATRERAALLLDWWVTRVREALATWSPI